MDYEKATTYLISVTEFQNNQLKAGIPQSAPNNK